MDSGALASLNVFYPYFIHMQHDKRYQTGTVWYKSPACFFILQSHSVPDAVDAMSQNRKLVGMFMFVNMNILGVYLMKCVQGFSHVK